MNPWNTKMDTAKLLSIDESEMCAHIEKDGHRLFAIIDMPADRLNLLVEMGGYYGITAFLDEQWHMVDYSYITPDMLTPSHKDSNGVDVYE